MSTAAVALVLASAGLHATWNLLAKRAAGGVGFVWLFSVGTVLIYGPAAVVYVLVAAPAFTLMHAAAGVVSGAIHVGYFVFLQRGYRVGDLSLVYPTARGSGPVLATLLAVVLLGERPGLQALLGTALVVTSVFVLAGGRGRTTRDGRRAVGFGLLTGAFIASYTVWDGYAVGHLGAAPLLFLVVGEVARTLLVTPFAALHRAEAMATWRRYRLEVLAVAALAPLAYLLVLTALQHAPISLVAPAREVSILITAVLGSRVLAEAEGARRMVAAVAMVTGVALLALA